MKTASKDREQSDSNIASNKQLSVEIFSFATRYGPLEWDNKSNMLLWLESNRSIQKLCAFDPQSSKIDIVEDNKKIKAAIGYGGGDFNIANGNVVYSEASTSKLYQINLLTKSRIQLTPKAGQTASPKPSPTTPWVMYINRDDEERDCLAVVQADGKQWPQILNADFDFYRQPCWHPNGMQIAFVAWNHPHMPWINSKIYVADIQMHAKGYPAISHLDAIPSPDMSASFQPQFCPKGNFVYFIRDDSQWGQLFRYNLQTKSVEKITDIQGECAQPNWVHDMRTYTLSHDGTQAFVVANKNTIHTIYQINLEKENESTHYQCTRWTNTHLWSEILQPTCSYDGRHLAFIGSAPDRPPEICLANLKENNAIQPLKSTIKSYPQFIDHQSNPIHLNWQDNGIKTYGLYWPPKSQPICKNGEKDIPPVIFKIHGGPTAQATTCWEPEAQFFTSKNIGVFYVNYRGSWGYGRKYMEAIKGQWGVCDVEDAISGLNYLERQGLASRKKSVIMGGSAGGYTVLQALCHYPQVFAAGICLYGVTDLFALSQQTHKFEKHYNDYLLGILPQATNVYTERSPINFADKIQKPIAIYQGKEDTVVAPQQMISFVDSLKKFNIPHFFHLYENEGHGFRLQETKEHLYRTMTDFIYNSIASDV